jgi:hypothetical protein
MPGCDVAAVDPEQSGALCRSHLERVNGTEPDTSPEESPSDDHRQGSDTLVEGSVAIDPGVFPTDLVDVAQWITWKEDDGRKVPRAPYEHSGWVDRYVDSQDPQTWRDLETVQEWAEKLPGHAPAFVIQNEDSEEYDHDGDPFVLIDYDEVRDPETDEIHPTVLEHVDRADSYADVSTSGTGVHIFARGQLPDGVKAIEAPLPEAEGFPDAEIEVYDSARYSAMTGAHIARTPTETTDCQAFLEDLAEEFATVAEGTPDELLREPETPKAELADVETTDDVQDVHDAIQHTGPRDVSLRSTVTQERGDGSKSMDPSWARSESGTRLAQVGDGWVYRKGMVGLDALQVVALEERIILDETDYPSGEDFWRAVDALRDRGAHIPEYEPPADREPVAALPIARLDALDPEQRRLYAARRGLEWPDTDGARERLRDALLRELRSENTTVLDAPTALGKSYNVATEPWRRRTGVTGGAPVVHLHATKDARDEAAQATADSSAEGGVLRAARSAAPSPPATTIPSTTPRPRTRRTSP